MVPAWHEEDHQDGQADPAQANDPGGEAARVRAVAEGRGAEVAADRQAEASNRTSVGGR